MQRRDFLAAAAGTLAGASLFGPQNAFAADKATAPGPANDLIFTDAKVLKQLKNLAEEAAKCATAGRACTQHCDEEMARGNGKEFARCAQSTRQMTVLCEAVSALASYKARAIADILDACIKACETCQKACKEHEPHFSHGMHAECKACMKSCEECIEECKKLKAMI